MWKDFCAEAHGEWLQGVWKGEVHPKVTFTMTENSLWNTNHLTYSCKFLPNYTVQHPTEQPSSRNILLETDNRVANY
jgi:hypothetical protein